MRLIDLKLGLEWNRNAFRFLQLQRMVQGAAFSGIQRDNRAEARELDHNTSVLRNTKADQLGYLEVKLTTSGVELPWPRFFWRATDGCCLFRPKSFADHDHEASKGGREGNSGWLRNRRSGTHEIRNESVVIRCGASWAASDSTRAVYASEG